MATHAIERAKQSPAEIFGTLEEAIVCGVFARVIPNTLGRIEFRPVRRQLEYFQIAPMLFEPVVGFLLLVIRSVVLNQIDAMSSPVEGRDNDLVQESQISFPLKIALLMQVDEAGVV